MFDLNGPDISGDCSKAFEKATQNLLYLSIVISVAWVTVSMTRLYVDFKRSITLYTPVDRVDKKEN